MCTVTKLFLHETAETIPIEVSFLRSLAQDFVFLFPKMLQISVALPSGRTEISTEVFWTGILEAGYSTRSPLDKSSRRHDAGLQHGDHVQ